MGSRVLVRNPESGDQRRSVQAAQEAEERGYEVLNTSEEGEEVDLAREAAAGGADVVVACGGDGTLNGVARGVDRAGRLEEVTLGVVPAGTGNGFAGNVGIDGVTEAFESVEAGRTRRLDVGMADWSGESGRGDGSDAGSSGAGDAGLAGGDADETARPFLNSCICGLTAEASARTEPALKQRLGVLAYVFTTLQHTGDFEGLELDIRAGSESDPVWSGEAALLLVGNARRFPNRQANVEDGKLDVVVIEDAPTIDYLARGAVERLFQGEVSHLTRLRVPSLVVDAGEPRQFSLDGEMVERERLEITTRERVMEFAVGEGYDPNPVDDRADGE
ncbi:diacylglycerol/lipid kinase family protein [Halorarum salinum]|uniref:Diacylglycerol kinase family lipid kinase n=1 Tax=Halorarum salinum TaxID=2743089 RepID=A0A7D5L9B4_9EURY|nr:diacylglycerol kinase family protein [Halobaculum salinum]QLG61366.1 diacylglycerol kinase family lipid kinase [Halobaculum salinum]